MRTELIALIDKNTNILMDNMVRERQLTDYEMMDFQGQMRRAHALEMSVLQEQERKALKMGADMEEKLNAVHILHEANLDGLRETINDQEREFKDALEVEEGKSRDLEARLEEEERESKYWKTLLKGERGRFQDQLEAEKDKTLTQTNSVLRIMDENRELTASMRRANTEILMKKALVERLKHNLAKAEEFKTVAVNLGKDCERLEVENDRFVNENVALLNRVSKLEADVYNLPWLQCKGDMIRGCFERNNREGERTPTVVLVPQTLHQVVTKRGGGLQGWKKEGSEKQNISAWQEFSSSAPLRR